VTDGATAVLDAGRQLWKACFDHTDPRSVRDQYKLNRPDVGWCQIRNALAERDKSDLARVDQPCPGVVVAAAAVGLQQQLLHAQCGAVGRADTTSHAVRQRAQRHGGGGADQAGGGGGGALVGAGLVKTPDLGGITGQHAQASAARIVLRLTLPGHSKESAACNCSTG